MQPGTHELHGFEVPPPVLRSPLHTCVLAGLDTRPHRLKHSGSLWHPSPPAVGDRRAAGAHSLGRAMEAAVERGQAGTEAKTAGPSPSGRGWPAWAAWQFPGTWLEQEPRQRAAGPSPQIAPGAHCSSLLTIPRRGPEGAPGQAQSRGRAAPAAASPRRAGRGCSLVLLNLRGRGWEAVARSLQTSLPPLPLAAKCRRQLGSKASHKLPGLAQGSARPPSEPACEGCPRAPRVPRPGCRAPACSPRPAASAAPEARGTQGESGTPQSTEP